MSSSSSRGHRFDHFTDPSRIEDLGLPIGTGVLPVLNDRPAPKKDSRSNAATGASAAGMRAFTAQAVAFYFRAPAKAFFRTRVDYLVYARSLTQEAVENTIHQTGKTRAIPWSYLWKNSTFGLLTNAVKTQGWRVLPEQVLPPLAANVAVGAILYTSYLHILGKLHEPSSEVRKRVYPPPGFEDTFTAGFLAGGIQSVVAAPLDALMVRYERRHAINGQAITDPMRHWTMVSYGREKLKEIGMRGIFAGWLLSFAKDSVGSGVFFSMFEYVKAQGYYKFVAWYYGSLKKDVVDTLARKRPDERVSAKQRGESKTIITPHYAMEPAFLLLAGVAATVAQQAVLFPLNMFQQRHFEHLEELDAHARNILKTDVAQRQRGTMFRAYINAYQETLKDCRVEAEAVGSLKRWLYKGFWWSTIRQVPSTAAGLIIFELVRRKYGLASDEVRISQDGYDILLQ